MAFIGQIILKNIKFFHEETIDLKKNVLFYGENGSGKSSLYWALKVYFENKLGIIQPEEYANFFSKDNAKNIRNRYYNEIDPEITITPSFEDLSKNSIHFVNHHTLSKLFSSDIDGVLNFFDILNDEWLKKYSFFDNLTTKNILINEIFNHEDKIAFEEELKEKVHALFTKTNSILAKNFEEKVITIGFKYEEIELKTLENESIDRIERLPNIQILVNDIVNPQHHFNEAKLKLISLAMHFAIIELSKPTESYNGLRLAVFDDFLQSLDMSYRSVVLDYIFDQMILKEKYQIILLTHDLIFYKLVKRKSELYDQTSNWEFKNIYVRETIGDGTIFTEPKIYTTQSYFQNAELFYAENRLEECGNFLRKELEYLLSLFLVNLSLGHKEMAQDMINQLKSNDKVDTFYFEPHKIVYQFKNKLSTSIKILEQVKSTNSMEKIDVVIQLFQKALNEFNSFKQVDVKRLRTILKALNYHKDTLLNTTSHGNDENLIRGEFKKAIDDIRELKKLIDPIKKPQQNNDVATNLSDDTPITTNCSFFTLLKKLLRLN